jgi:hypothetical protein
MHPEHWLLHLDEPTMCNRKELWQKVDATGCQKFEGSAQKPDVISQRWKGWDPVKKGHCIAQLCSTGAACVVCSGSKKELSPANYGGDLVPQGLLWEACTAERNWSAWDRTCTSLRNRLSLETAQRMVCVKANLCPSTAGASIGVALTHLVDAQSADW